MKAIIPLTPEQIEIANDPSRIRVLIASRRYGKSTLLTALHSQIGCRIPGFSLTLNPYQSQSDKFYTQNVNAFPHMKRLLVKEPKVWPWPKMNFKGTNHEWEIRCFERNPEALLGGKLTFLSLDECADFDSDEALRILLPRLSDMRGRIFITGTVTTEQSFLWQYYMKGQPGKDKDPNVRSWLYDYSHCYVFQGPEGEKELAFQKSQVSSWVFSQQFECKPASDGASAFQYLDEVLISDDPPTKPQEGRRYLVALDIGRVVNQGFATVIDDTGLIVAAEPFPLGCKHEVYAQRVAALARFWNAGLIADATGGGGSGGERSAADSYILVYKKHFPRLKEFFFSPNSATQNKYELVTSLQLQIEQGLLKIPKKHRVLIEQMRNYRVIVKPTHTTFGALHGQDDGVASLLMAAWQYKRGKLIAGMSEAAFAGG